jgi:hypothetical protein
VLDIFVPEVGLQRTGVMTGIGQRVAGGVAQHVRVDLEAQLGMQEKKRLTLWSFVGPNDSNNPPYECPAKK